ncbi:MAG: glycosyltransferase family 2 protein [Lachnospiraceae bacterium]|nr:glycosyltransferase family 2 protein [Lachnospiraceae bacterium]
MEKNVSVIIPCHNVSETVSRTWDSLKAQTIGLSALECIFVDDASDDGGATWETLSKIEAESPESVLILHLEENLRQGGARNAALQHASGEYMIFLDADDTLSPETCASLFGQAIEEKTDIIQFRHHFVRDDDSGVPLPKDKPPEGRRLFDLTNDADRSPFLNGFIATFGCTNKFYRMELVRRTRSTFAEHRYYEEPKFVYPLFLYANRVLLTDDAYYHYHWHADSTMTSGLGKHLLDHPQVQLELLEDLMSREDLFKRFRTEIETQFVFSFYCETLLFAKANNGFLPLAYFQQMQQICRTIFPDALRNETLCSIAAAKPMLSSLSMSFSSQEELNRFIYDAV